MKLKRKIVLPGPGGTIFRAFRLKAMKNNPAKFRFPTMKNNPAKFRFPTRFQLGRKSLKSKRSCSCWKQLVLVYAAISEIQAARR